MTGENIIEVEKMVKAYGDFHAVDGISFNVKKGEIFGFLGANGAGKTTAIKILIGISKPTSGKINVAGFDLNTDQEKVKRRIGYMSQKFSLYNDLSIVENIRLFAGIYGLSDEEIAQKTRVVLENLGLETQAKSLISSLPLGWKQKLAFSVSMIHDPDIVFLDEPTGGVDPITRRQFWDLIYQASEGGTTIFVTTHYMDEAEYCDRISMMVSGKIAAMGSPDELKSGFRAEDMNEVFVKIAREGGTLA